MFLPALVLAGKLQNTPVLAYPISSIYQKSTQFTLHVENVEIPIVSYNDKYDYAHFEVSKGQLSITITIQDQEINNYNISPKKYGLVGKVVGKQLFLRLDKALYLIIKINNKKELVIAIDQQKEKLPKPSGQAIFNVESDYKADRTGKTLSTASIQKAVDDAAALGNGTVYVPPGIYLIGNLELKSNCSVYMAPGAVFLFSGNAQDYAINARKVSQNRNITWWIFTKPGARNIRFYGSGTLDGNGKLATEKGRIGNHILAIFGTQNFTMDGLIIRDSGAWAILPVRSKNIKLLNFKLFNRFDMGENDGVDVIESENVLVRHAIGIALDDPFSTKTWDQGTDLCRNWPGVPLAQKNVVFDDCVSWTYCYGFKIGQGVKQPQSEVRFKNCVVYDAAVGIGIHHKWGTASVKNVVFDHIDIERLSYQNDDHRTWAVFLMQNGDQLGGGPIGNVTVSHVKIWDLGKSPGKIKGQNTKNAITNLTFRHVQLPNESFASSLQEIRMTDTVFTRNIKVIP